MLADWQEVWHSPHPPFLAESARFLEFRVLILFMVKPSFSENRNYLIIVLVFDFYVKREKTKKPSKRIASFYIIKAGSRLLSQAVPHQVPSAVSVLTVVFEMGTGVSPRRITTSNSPSRARTYNPPVNSRMLYH